MSRLAWVAWIESFEDHSIDRVDGVRCDGRVCQDVWPRGPGQGVDQGRVRVYGCLGSGLSGFRKKFAIGAGLSEEPRNRPVLSCKNSNRRGIRYFRVG